MQDSTQYLRELRESYDRFSREVRDIRQQVKDEFARKIEDEVKARTRAAELDISQKLVDARRRGMKRSDLTWVIRTNTSAKFDRFMELGGWERPETRTVEDVKRGKFESKKQELLDRMGLTEFVDDRFETAYRAENGAILKVQESGHLLPIPDEEQPETKTEGWVDWFRSVKSDRRELSKLLREEKNGE